MPSHSTTEKLILASASPRRQELLRAADIPFEVHPAHLTEEQMPGEPPLGLALRLAREKAETIAQQFPGRFVLGADTIVVAGDEVLGKPLDQTDAIRMLRQLSDRRHHVTTAVSLIAPVGQPDTRACTTEVVFRRLDEETIRRYVASGEPMDKAGGYAIQGGAAEWALQIDGDYSNVVGLPVILVRAMLTEKGFFSLQEV